MKSGNESAASDSSRSGFSPPGPRRWTRAGLAALLAIGVVAFAGAQKGPAAPASSKGTAPVRQPSDAELIRRRTAWFHDQRAFPLGFIPAGARLRALEQLRQMKAAQQQTRQFQTFGAAAASDPPWTPVGPQPSTSPDFAPFVSGRVTALALDPHDTTGNTVYLGAAQGGVWKTTNSGITWTPLTDSQPSLAVGSLAIDPSTTTSTIYVGTGEENFAIDSYYGAGVLKSTDGGTTWTQDNTFKALIPISSRSGGPRIGALAIDPLNHSILLAAVQGSGSVLQSGIWCSADAGVTWAHVLPAAGITGVPATDVVFGADGTAYAGLTILDSSIPNPNSGVSGVYRSATPVPPVTSCMAFASGSWTQLALPGVSNTSIGRVALGIGPISSMVSKTTLFAAIADALSGSMDLLGVFTSSNGGSTWTQLTDPLTQPFTGFCEAQCFYDLVIRVDPGNPNVVFAGGSATPAFGGNATLIRSTNGGASWTEVSNNTTSNGIHVDMHAIAFSATGSVMYVGNDGGVWSTANPTATAISWTNRNATLGTLQFYPGLSVHPSNPAFRSFGGTQDNGLQRYNGGIPSNLLQWDDTGTLGDGGFTAIDPNFPSNTFAASEFFPGFFLLIVKSTQNGDGLGLVGFAGTNPTFACIAGTIQPPCPATGINIGDRGNFIPPLVIDPNSSTTSERVYFGTFQLYRSLDGGNTWNSISPDLTLPVGALAGCMGTDGVDCLSAVAVAPSDPNTIYTGAGNSQVNVSRNALLAPSSVTWTNITTGLPTRAVTAIAVHPANPQTAYVTFSGFSSCSSCDHLGHVFQTLTGGPPWTDISGIAPNNLPDIPVNDTVIDPDVPNTLYVATDIGVFVTSNANLGAGTTWAPLGTGLPNVAVLSLKLDRAARQLFGATHGRSVWEFQLSAVPAFNLATINPASASVGGVSFPLTVTGNGFTPSSVVKWTIGSNTFTLMPQLVTPPPSATQFAVSVPQAAIAGGGVAQVQVATDSTLTMLSSPLLFTVLNPVPTVTSISPTTSTAPAASNLTLRITGTGFTASSLVQLFQLAPLNSSCLSTTLNSSTQLTSVIQASCLNFGGEFVTVVTNPPPGGGSSCPSPDPLLCPAATLTARAPAPANDPISAATIIGANSLTLIEDNSGATANTGSISDPIPPSTPGLGCDFVSQAVNMGVANSVWFKFTASVSGPIIIDTIGSAYDTILSVWTGTPGSLANIACNDDINPGVDRVSRVSFNANVSVTYFVMVSAFEGDGGKTVLNFSGSVTPTPNYVTAALPTSATVKAGQSTSAITVTLTPQTGSVSGSVTLFCSGLPANAKISCSFSSSSSSFVPPNTVNLGTSAVMVTLTISTTATSGAFPVPLGPATRLPVYAPWLSLATMALLSSLWVARRALRRRLVFSFACAFLLVALLVLQVSCSGGGTGTRTPVPGTPPGIYPVTVGSNPPSSGGQAPPMVTLTVTP